MRKRDFLRNFYEKAKKEGDDTVIYYIDLPACFKRADDVEMPVCLPVIDEKGCLVGIAVEHPYEYEGDVFTDNEYYYFA